MKFTLYVGEKFDVSSAKSIKSSKKSVVKTGKDTSGSYVQHYMIAKKAGSATVTVKSKFGGTTKYKVTVKKNKCKVTLSRAEDGSVIIAVKNTSGQIFENGKVRYTLKTPDGSVYEENEQSVYRLLNKKTAYYTIYVRRDVDIDLSQSKAKITDIYHNPNYTYKNNTAKINIKTKASEADREIELDMTAKNKDSLDADGMVYIMIKDSANKTIGIEHRMTSLSKKSTQSFSTSIYKSSYPSYDHYEVAYTFYSMKYKG